MGSRALAKIIAPSVAGFLLVSVILLCCYYFYRRKMKRKTTLAPPPDLLRDPMASEHRVSLTREALSVHRYDLRPVPSQQSESITFNPYQFRPPINQPPPAYSAKDKLSREERRANYLRSAENRAFLTFLSSYGPGGVSLRELIMLATLRQAERESNNHWLVSGEVGTFEEAMIMPETILERQEWVFSSFVKDGLVDSSTIESFQELLESLRFIKVKYPKAVQSDEACLYWHTDERMWTAWEVELSEPSAPIDDFAVLRQLLDLFIVMPDKDVSPSAQRQREMYYYPAHLLICRIIRSRGLLEQDWHLFKQAVFVALQLMTHRYRLGDSLLLDFVRGSSISSLYPNINVMLLWAELKEKTFQEDYDGLCIIRDRALYLVNANEVQSQAAPRLNGLLGFLLVDLIKCAKIFRFEDIVADAVKLGTKWADTAQRNSTSIEKTALCEVLAIFNIHARDEVIRKEYFLFYGYHLSRAGFLAQGDQFLFRGLENRDLTLLWSYEMERVSNALRLGRSNQAARMLESIRERALRNRDERPSSILWKLSGQCAENFVLLDLYEADCSASAGRLDDACAKLKSGIGITSSVYDAYIQILRITLEMRLLEILMRQGSLEEALPVALKLSSVFLDEKTSSVLAPDTIHGIVQQSLDLSNSLLSAENAAASMALLENISVTGPLLPGELSKEIKSYVEQLMTKARQVSETRELSVYDQTVSTLDTGVEESITHMHTDPRNEPTVLIRKETTVRANSSFPPKLSNATHLQTLARKRREGYKLSSPKAFQSRMYASSLRKLQRAPRPPSTEPDKHKRASGEQVMQQEGTSSWHEVKPSIMVPAMP